MTGVLEPQLDLIASLWGHPGLEAETGVSRGGVCSALSSRSEQRLHHCERGLLSAVTGRGSCDAGHVGPRGEQMWKQVQGGGGYCPRVPWLVGRQLAGVWMFFLLGLAWPSSWPTPLQAARANLEKAQSELSGAADEAARAEIQIRIEANEALVKALE